MIQRRTQRMLKVAERMKSLPLSPEAEEAAFERFRETGELPDYQRLAAAAVDRALSFREEASGPPEPIDHPTAISRLLAISKALATCALEPRKKPMRIMLFHEAVHGPDLVQQAARAAIKVLVSIGRDVTDPGFFDEDMELPEFGTLGLHMLGFPGCLVAPPYEAQARRMLDRLAVVREQVDHVEEGWFEDFAECAAQFFNGGGLPDDGFMCDAVLVYGELLALGRQLGNEADPEVLAALDQAARAAGKERGIAIERVRALAAQGRIP